MFSELDTFQAGDSHCRRFVDEALARCEQELETTSGLISGLISGLLIELVHKLINGLINELLEWLRSGLRS